MSITKKQEKLLTVLKKGGNDASLFVMEKVVELEEKVDGIRVFWEDEITELKQNNKETIQEIKEDNKETIREIKESIPNLNKVLESVRGEKGVKGDVGEKGDKGDKGESIIGEMGKDGRDGKNGVNGKDGKDGKNGIDGKNADEQIIIEKIENDLPKLGDKIRNSLELLQGEERLDKSAIKGLEESVQELKEHIQRIGASNARFGMRKIPVVKRINLSNQLNGEAREFELPRDTVDILGVWGTSFPINFNPTDGDRADWDLVGNKLVLRDGVPAPEAEQTLWCLVETFFY